MEYTWLVGAAIVLLSLAAAFWQDKSRNFWQ
jgi:hypothetical protein